MGIRGRGKRGKDLLPRGWLRDAFDKCYTIEQWQEGFKSLDWSEKIKYRLMLEPKEIKATTDNNFTLQILGINPPSYKQLKSKNVKSITTTVDPEEYIHGSDEYVEDSETV